MTASQRPSPPPDNGQRPPGGERPPGLAAPARRALAGAGFTALTELAEATEAELAALHGMGPRALALLRDALAAHGLSFR